MSVDLSTNYLGIRLRSPLVASASPLTAKLESLQKLEQAGAAAAVLPSLFEEQIEHEEQQLAKLHDYHAESFAESLSYFPEQEDYRVGADDYLRLIQDAKNRLAIPIIGSLNGSSTGGWTALRQGDRRSGADALELNIYFVPTEPLMTGRMSSSGTWSWWKRSAAASRFRSPSRSAPTSAACRTSRSG